MKDSFTVQFLNRFSAGPLQPYIGSFATLIQKEGYARSTAENQLRMVGHFGDWLALQGFDAKDIREDLVSAFVDELKAAGKLRRGGRAVLQKLLHHLRTTGNIAAHVGENEKDAVTLVVDRFSKYLTKVRGLSQATIDTYETLIRRFLTSFGSQPIDLRTLDPKVVRQFILGYAPTVSRGQAKLMVTALRSFFRYLHLQGEIGSDLAACVPTVPNWRMSGIPKGLEPEAVERIIASCDRSTDIGRRDYSILLLLARLGLRAGEVVSLTLDNLDWDAGELRVQGKSKRRDRVPIPVEVGKALAEYLQVSRPECSTRRLFVRIKAPRRGFSSSVAICNIVRRALGRAGINSPRKGAHLLRHSLAIGMLRRGASLAEIGEILRHRSLNTTEIYAKVDLGALSTLAQPWPGGDV